MSGSPSKNTVVIPAPFGSVSLVFANQQLIACELSYRKPRSKTPDSPDYARSSVRAVDNYFHSANLRQRVPMQIHGTDFQKRVWTALQAIPPGETATYGEIAAKLGSGARAVANACRQNPLPLFIPCHRVVAAKGMGGFMGQTSGKELGIKRWLLRHEAAH